MQSLLPIGGIKYSGSPVESNTWVGAAASKEEAEPPVMHSHALRIGDNFRLNFICQPDVIPITNKVFNEPILLTCRRSLYDDARKQGMIFLEKVRLMFDFLGNF
jgi:hypothetical protein